MGSTSRDRVGATVSRVGHAATWPHAAECDSLGRQRGRTRERDSLRRVLACNRRPAEELRTKDLYLGMFVRRDAGHHTP
jgi:hypothetical protein